MRLVVAAKTLSQGCDIRTGPRDWVVELVMSATKEQEGGMRIIMINFVASDGGLE